MMGLAKSLARQAQKALPGWVFDTPGVSAFFIPEALRGQCMPILLPL